MTINVNAFAMVRDDCFSMVSISLIWGLSIILYLNVSRIVQLRTFILYRLDRALHSPIENIFLSLSYTRSDHATSVCATSSASRR